MSHTQEEQRWRWSESLYRDSSSFRGDPGDTLWLADTILHIHIKSEWIPPWTNTGSSQLEAKRMLVTIPQKITQLRSTHGTSLNDGWSFYLLHMWQHVFSCLPIHNITSWRRCSGKKKGWMIMELKWLLPIGEELFAFRVHGVQEVISFNWSEHNFSGVKVD